MEAIYLYYLKREFSHLESEDIVSELGGLQGCSVSYHVQGLGPSMWLAACARTSLQKTKLCFLKQLFTFMD